MYPDILMDSQIPKYEQIIKLIVSDIQAGIYKLGERISSINEISEEYLVSRATVEKAYKKNG
jgi:DNA-binding GntR family transcriptional regulator